LKKKINIIAEVGVNHNGSLIIAKKLIDTAKKSGADYVKFQTFKAENLVRKNTKIKGYQKKNIKKKITQFELLQKLQLTSEDHKVLIKYCKKKKIKFLSSPFDIESCKLLIKLGLKEFKIPSGELDNYPLLVLIGKTAKKVFLSTGMANIQEIKNSKKILIKNGLNKKDLVILHCNTDYPANLNEVNLLALNVIKKNFKTNYGFSDHTLGSEAAIASVALGASIIEKHITLSKHLSGPDHSSSMEPSEFKKFVTSIRNCEKLLGYEKKIPSNSEKKNMFTVRKSIVAKKNIRKGEFFSEVNLTCKRPFNGLSPFYWPLIIGKKAKKNYLKDETIKIKI